MYCSSSSQAIALCKLGRCHIGLHGVLAGLAAAWCQVAVKLNVWTPNPTPQHLAGKNKNVNNQVTSSCMQSLFDV